MENNVWKPAKLFVMDSAPVPEPSEIWTPALPESQIQLPLLPIDVAPLPRPDQQKVAQNFI